MYNITYVLNGYTAIVGAHKHNACQPPSFPFSDRVDALVV
jgi:hypothetical protein